MSASNKPEPNFARVIAISSGKGGVGKSILTTNLGIAFSQAGKKVCLFDADTNLANINILLGITPKHTLQHFFENDVSIKESLTKGPGGIDIVCGASGAADFIQLSLSQQQKLTQGLHTLEKNYDYLLIDTAAGIDETNISLILAAPCLILTITREPTSLTDAFSLLRVLKKYHFKHPILVIVNMIPDRKTAQTVFKRFKNAVNKYLQLEQCYFAGYVLSDKNIPGSILNQRAILLDYPDSPASQCILQICERLLTSFGKKTQTHAEFSEYFNDLILLEDNSVFAEDVELIPESIIPASPQGLETKQPDLLQTGLLRASHYARLLGKQRNN